MNKRIFGALAAALLLMGCTACESEDYNGEILAPVMDFKAPTTTTVATAPDGQTKPPSDGTTTTGGPMAHEASSATGASVITTAARTKKTKRKQYIITGTPIPDPTVPKTDEVIFSEKEVRGAIRIMGTDVRSIPKTEGGIFTRFYNCDGVYWRNMSSKTIAKILFTAVAYEGEAETAGGYRVIIEDGAIPPTKVGYVYHDRMDKKEEWKPVCGENQINSIADIIKAPEKYTNWSGKKWLDKNLYIERNNSPIKLSAQEKQQNTAIISVNLYDSMYEYHGADKLRVETIEIFYEGEEESLFFGKQSTKHAFW